jgi:SNF2 family DNA or RNA helicase
VLNPKAAGVGLNITAATIVIQFTPLWAPALETQASARSHRRGQTKRNTINSLSYENTIKRVTIDRSRWKAELGNDLVPVSPRDVVDYERALHLSLGVKNKAVIQKNFERQ